MITSTAYIILIALAFLLSWLAFRPTLRWAQHHHVEDRPNTRKLQDHPIPMLGGVAIAVGIFVPLIIAQVYFRLPDMGYQLTAMAAMLVLGVLDDLYDIPAWLRFLIEMLLVWLLLWGTESLIDDFHGLWGITMPISIYLALPLSIIAGVGIINSINLIDGVDGYSSGYGIMANLLFAAVFHMLGCPTQELFSIVAAAALIPFFFHNVFGRTTKMYLGDGGSLLIGMIMACNVFCLLSHSPKTLSADTSLGIVALALAILSIPVFDTIRVMFARIFRGQSPLLPDKTHLHHRYISLGYSHVGTSFTILSQNLLIVILWWICYRLGGGIDLQFWLVVFLSVLATVGFYYGTEYDERHKNRVSKRLRQCISHTQIEQSAFWMRLQKWVDAL